jgi:hypothetical protein
MSLKELMDNETLNKMATKLANAFLTQSIGLKNYVNDYVEKEKKKNDIYQFEKATGKKWDESKGQDNYKTGTDHLKATWNLEGVIENIEHDFFEIPRPLTKKQNKQKQTRKNQSFYDKKHKAKFIRG